MTEERNPYAAPASRVVPTATAAVAEDSALPVLADRPQARPAGEGGEWLSEGWQLFRRQPVPLVALCLVYFIIYMVVASVLSLLPLIGGIVAMGFSVVFLSGLTLAADRLYRGEEVNFDQLFDGFQHPARVRLALLGIMVGVLYLLIGVLAATLAGALPFWQAAVGLSDADPGVLLASGELPWMPVLLMILYSLLLAVPLTMGIWFSGGLVLFNGQGPLESLLWSFRACLRNILPLTVYSLLLALLFVASIFTLFLGLLVLWPLFILSWYVSYRRICTVRE
ncbi:MAG: BPSS1780 family membrane protein [Pseudomonadota bacterium]